MSSNITLSAATRQNLLSLQDTANLLSTTQNRLSTGKKVNTALDNPVNFFTSQSLGARSSDLSSLLDGISNGIQTIQAANQGITNISKLTQQLKSTAQQALAASNAFTAKASVSSATTVTVDATTKSILGGTAGAAATATGGTAYTGAGISNGSSAVASTSTGTVAVANDTALQALSGAITVDDGAGNTATYTISNTSTKAALTAALSTSGFTATFDANDHLQITRADGTNFTATGAGATATGSPAGTGGSAATSADTFSLTVGGTTVNLTAAASGANTFQDLNSLVTAINSSSVGSASAAAGKVTASVGTGANAGKLVLTGGDTATSFTAGGTAATKLGVPTTAQTPTAGGGLTGQTLTVSVGGAAATTITFGTGANQVSTLDQLNAALSAANAQASIDTAGNLSITTTNEAGAESLQLGGTATGAGQLFTDVTSHTATLGGDGKTSRDKLVNDYNNLRTQIDQLAKDASFNGVNLLNGDTLKVIFNEKNTSSLSVKGVALDSDTLGISTVGSTDFQDSTSINKVLDQLSSATGVLNSQAATYGSNLSVVQNRQDFSKNLINILDTGSSNLTSADLNEEAANSQALSTRNSLAISALSLANQAQQGILQLLR
jgi:hypothetical protein